MPSGLTSHHHVRPQEQERLVSPVDATPSALVLDLDGVLVDTLPVMREAWKAVQLTHGITLPFERYAKHLGRPFDDIMAQLDIDDATAVHDTYTKASAAAASLTRAVDGMEEVLWAFARAGWRLAIVTSKALDRAAPLIARLGCPFASIRTPESTGRGKPRPDHLL